MNCGGCIGGPEDPGDLASGDLACYEPPAAIPESTADFPGAAKLLISLVSRVNSAVEQRFCKPLVGSSILSPGTTWPPDARTILERIKPQQRIELPAHDDSRHRCRTASA